jgi:hypothetical protein
MQIQSLETIQVSDANISKFQDNIKSFSLQLDSIPFLKGRMLTITDINGNETIDIPLTTTATSLPHKLGTPPIGFIVTFQNSNAVVYASSLPKITDTNKDFLKLQASSNVTVNIWVF